MRAHIRNRASSTSINAVPPPRDSSEYSPEMEKAAAGIVYRSPIPSKTGHTVYILNAAALPDAREVNFDTLLPYVLARLPGEDDLVNGVEYEVIFFAGGSGDVVRTTKKNRPGWSWFIQAYHVLSRAMRKRIQTLYIVHERTWVRVLVEMFSTIASPKFRRKIVHASTLSALALQIPIENLLIPPSAYQHDRKISPDIFAPYVSGKRAFCAKTPIPRSPDGQSRLPRVLRETTAFILMNGNVRTEGIFRIPPNLRLKEILREAYDRAQKFIVWREGPNILPLPPYDGAEDVETVVKELDANDTYGVHLAAGLCKLWYSELREPVVPASCYRELRKLFGNPEDIPDVQRLSELLSTTSEWSALPAVSREILTRHLLPMLSAIAAQQGHNRMSAENLAVCFGATLLCGPDQLEDAKMSSILRRIIRRAVELWEPQLREACGVRQDAFTKDLQAPNRLEDYEDPLDEVEVPGKLPASPTEYEHVEQQRVGIVLQDNDDEALPEPPAPTTGSGTLPARPSPLVPHQLIPTPAFEPASSEAKLSPALPPPLPPRQTHADGAKSGSGSDDPNLKRKPAPPLIVPPRYSVIAARPSDVTESPTTYMAVADGFGPSRSSGWSPTSELLDSGVSPTGPHNPKVKRKPVTPQSSTDTE